MNNSKIKAVMSEVAAEAAERDEVGEGEDLGRRVLRGADGTLRGVHCLRLGRVCVGDGLDAPLDSLRSL